MSDNDADAKSRAMQSRMGRASRAISGIMHRCIKHVSERVSSALESMAYREGMSPEQARSWLNQPLDGKTYAQLFEEVKRSGNTQLAEKMARDSLRFEYYRRQALVDIIKNALFVYSGQYKNGLRAVYFDTAYEAYGRAMFDVQKGARTAFVLTSMPTRLLNRALKKQLDYTEAVYTLSNTVGKVMKKALIDSVIEGQGVREISRRINETGDVVPWKAKAIARTSLTEIANDVEAETIEDAGLTRYRYMATLDERTCPICGERDGKEFPLSQRKVGINCPPMHPNCRCTTTAVFTQETLATFRRSAKVGKEWTEMPGDMTYAEWSKTYLKPKKKA